MDWKRWESAYAEGNLSSQELMNAAAQGLNLPAEATKEDWNLQELWDSGINLIAAKASNEVPDWLLFAGRLKMILRRLRVAKERGFGQGDLWRAFEYNAKQGFYTDELLLHYSIKDFRSFQLAEDLDLDYDLGGANLLNKRYLLPGETMQEALAVIALWLAVPEKRVRRLAYAQKFYELLSKRYISLATPLLMNLRRPGGQLSSCFILGVEDSLVSLAQCWTDTALISQRAGGVGVDLSLIRATGSQVAGVPNASGGVVPWVRILNDIAVAVNQQGKRKGAVTVAVGVWHLDIFEFLELRSEAGDLRRRAPDIFPQVIIPDCFMEAVEADGEWWLHDPYEVEQLLGKPLTYADLQHPKLVEAIANRQLKLSKPVSARSVLKAIMRAQLETGLPYLFFANTVNAANPNLGGYIPCANLCQESYSVVKAGEYAHCCNLASLNLSLLLNNKLVEEVSRYAIRILDNAIEVTNPPIQIAKEHNRRFRTVGLGAMGLADWLAWHELAYDSTQALEAVNNLFERIALASYESSVELAQERGTFDDYASSSYALSEPLVMGRPLSWYLSHSQQPERWRVLFSEIKRHGLRNSQLLAIAPNSSTALVHRCVPSVMPVYRRFYVNQGTNSTPVAPPYLSERYWFYKEYRSLCLKKVIDMVATIQKWVDTGISFEWLFDLNQPHVNAKYVYECILHAWRQKIKTIYYVRTLEKRHEECESCAN